MAHRMKSAKEEMITLLEDQLLPHTVEPESKVFFLKMRGEPWHHYQLLGMKRPPALDVALNILNMSN